MTPNTVNYSVIQGFRGHHFQSIYFEIFKSWSEKPFRLQCYAWFQRPPFFRVFIFEIFNSWFEIVSQVHRPPKPYLGTAQSKAGPTLGVKSRAHLGSVLGLKDAGVWSHKMKPPETRKVTKSRAWSAVARTPSCRPSSASGGLGFQPGKQDDESRTLHVRFSRVKQWCA